MECSKCNDKIQGVVHKIQIGKHIFNLCEDCFNSHRCSVPTFSFDDTNEEASENYCTILNDLINDDINDDKDTGAYLLFREYQSEYNEMTYILNINNQRIEEYTVMLNNVSESDTVEKEEIENKLNEYKLKAEEVEEYYLNKLSEIDEDLKKLGYDINSGIIPNNELENDLLNIRGHSKVCNQCCKVLDKSRKLKLNGVTGYFCSDCYEEVASDNDIDSRSVRKTIEKDQKNKCSSCEKHLNFSNRHKTYLIDDDMYTNLCNECYEEYIDNYRSTSEYKMGRRKRIFAIILFILFGVGGYFLFDYLIPKYGLTIVETLIGCGILLLVYSSYACRILKINFVYKIANFFERLKLKIHLLFFGEVPLGTQYVINKEDKGFFYALFIFVFGGILTIILKFIFFIIFGILKLIFTIPFGIFTLPFAFRRSKLRFDLYYDCE